MKGSGRAVPLIFMCGFDGAFGQDWLGKTGIAGTVTGVDGGGYRNQYLSAYTVPYQKQRNGFMTLDRFVISPHFQR